MMSNLEERVAELEARLNLLEAERGILQTLYRYGHVVDYGPVDQRLDCFTEDGVFHLVPKGKVTTEFIATVERNCSRSGPGTTLPRLRHTISM